MPRRMIFLTRSTRSSDWRAQVSLEFLLLAAAFLGLLGLFVSVFQSVEMRASVALESLRVQSFADRVQQKAGLIAVLGNGSSVHLAAVSRVPWRFSFSDASVELEAVFPDNPRLLDRALPLPVQEHSCVVSGGFELRLQNENGRLVVDCQPD